MIILGIDPGTLITGYGVIETRSNTMRMISCGAIKNNSRMLMPERLKHIFETLTTIVEQFHPDEFAIETAFYGKNAQSALKLGHARGVAMIAAVTRDIPVFEYSPREVKKGIVGKGNASKEQVQFMVKNLLRLNESPKYYDITDALAVSICHLHRRTAHQSKPFKSWKTFLTAHPEKISHHGKKPV